MKHGLDLLSVVVPLIAAVVSAVFTSVLLWRLTRLPLACRKRLLVRQLRHLAVANLVFAVAASMELVVEVVVSQMRPDAQLGLSMAVKRGWCIFIMLLENVGSDVSILLECHLAMAFSASICSGVKTLEALDFSLTYATWPLGVTLAFVETALLLHKIEWRPDIFGPDFNSPNGTACGCDMTDVIWLAVVSSGVTLCILNYVVSSVRVMQSGHLVQRHVWTRARLYVAVAIITIGPSAIHECIIKQIDTDDVVSEWSSLISATLYNLHGMMNAVLYAMHCKYARAHWSSPEMIKEAAEDRLGHSFRVGFRRGPDSVFSISVFRQSRHSSGRFSSNTPTARQSQAGGLSLGADAATDAAATLAESHLDTAAPGGQEESKEAGAQTLEGYYAETWAELARVEE